MNAPILQELLLKLEAVVFWAEQSPTTAQDLAAEALVLTREAIEAIQGAREDAFRMSGRVPVCTELLDMLAPDECTFEELLAKHPKLDAAFLRLMRLDANGACVTATDIQDAVVYGCLSTIDAACFEAQITAACDRLESEEA